MTATMPNTITTIDKKIQINTAIKHKTSPAPELKIMTNTNSSSIKITKRDGTQELLDINKIHFVVEEACEELSGVSASQIEINANLQFYDGITSKDIQHVLVRSANDLTTLENPNYQYAASRLLLYDIRKEAHGQYEYMPLLKLIVRNIRLGVYDKGIVEQYNKTEIKKLNTWIRRDRDLNFAYAGLRQVVDKYLVQDRSTGQIYETPQDMYMMIAATLFAEYPKNKRMTYVKRYYDAISQFKINIPTPVMSGVRTPIRQFASCVLVDSDDTLSSIFSSDMAIGMYVARRAGIGINAGRIRGINAKIRGGEVQHTGVVPFLKKFESTVRCCTQNGVRGGSATVHFPIWHQEIEDILVLKNNKGTEDNRVRKLDYSIQLSKLFYERFINNEDITLFSPHDVPGLYDAFGTDAFDALYVTYEKESSLGKKISAQELFFDLLKERAETGRIYIMNLDHCNTHSSFKDKISMSNLCLTGDTLIQVKDSTDKSTAMSMANFVEQFELGALNTARVQSYDVGTNKIVWSLVTNSAKTATVNELVEIEDEVGNIIRCTPDHQIYTQNRGYVKASELTEIDVLCVGNRLPK